MGVGVRRPAPVFWFPFYWDLFMSRNLEYLVSHHCSWGLGVVLGKGPGHVPKLWLSKWLTSLLLVGARAGDCSAWLPSSVLVHQGLGE